MKPPFDVICILSKGGAEGALIEQKVYKVREEFSNHYLLYGVVGGWFKYRFKLKIHNDVEQFIDGLLNEKE